MIIIFVPIDVVYVSHMCVVLLSVSQHIFYCALLHCESFIHVHFIPLFVIHVRHLFVIHVRHPRFPLNEIKKYLT